MKNLAQDILDLNNNYEQMFIASMNNLESDKYDLELNQALEREMRVVIIKIRSAAERLSQAVLES